MWISVDDVNSHKITTMITTMRRRHTTAASEHAQTSTDVTCLLRAAGAAVGYRQRRRRCGSLERQNSIAIMNTLIQICSRGISISVAHKTIQCIAVCAREQLMLSSSSSSSSFMDVAIVMVFGLCHCEVRRIVQWLCAHHNHSLSRRRYAEIILCHLIRSTCSSFTRCVC